MRARQRHIPTTMTSTEMHFGDMGWPLDTQEVMGNRFDPLLSNSTPSNGGQSVSDRGSLTELIPLNGVAQLGSHYSAGVI